MATKHADDLAAAQGARNVPPRHSLALLSPSTGEGAVGLHRVRPRRQGPQTDDVALARAQRARERAGVEHYVESRLSALEHDESYTVPRLHVVITGSLAPASALKLIEQFSERSFQERNTPWVSFPLETWVNYTGLAEEDWVAAREVLRTLGLIQERRRYDLEAGELVVEVAFMAEVFSAEVARLREQLREQAWTRMRDTPANG